MEIQTIYGETIKIEKTDDYEITLHVFDSKGNKVETTSLSANELLNLVKYKR